MEQNKIIEEYPVAATVIFTEDDWNTSYEGYILESSALSHYIRSHVYGTLWVPKENVKLKN